MSEPASPPSDDDRRHAACLAMGSAPGLIRFAARYTRSLHDAEDAYQRAMEIALTRAPVTEHRRFMAWLHTVLRNEALAVARVRRREGPGAEADVTEAYENTLEAAARIDAIAEWRERYRSIQDGLAGLTDAQRICLMLQTAGVSYEQIREITGFSLRKVERSVIEGRSRLAAWEVRLASGEACERLDAVIGRVAAGQATAKEARVVSRHVRHCGHCRAVLRDRRESNEWLAGLVPVAFLSGHAFAGAPDPTPVIAWWERVSGGATVRMGSVVQVAMDLPSTALAKVGAGAAAVAVAGAAGAPIVADAIRPTAAEPEVAAIIRSAASPLRTAAATTALDAERIARAFEQARRDAARATGQRRARSAPPRSGEATGQRRARSAPPRSGEATAPRRGAAPVRSVAVATSVATRSTAHVVAPAPRPAAAPRVASPSPPPTAAAVALEFGP